MNFWKRYWLYIRPFKNMIALSLIWIFFSELVQLARPYVMKVVFDVVGVIAGSDLQDANSILGNGLKVEEGDQQTLLRRNGLYRKLCEMQELKIIS